MSNRENEFDLNEEAINEQYALYDEQNADDGYDEEYADEYDEEYSDDDDDEVDSGDYEDVYFDGEPPRKRGKGWLIAVIAALVVALLGAGAYYYLSSRPLSSKDIAVLMDNGTIYEGVMIDKVPVGGLTVEQAREKIAEHEQSRIDTLKWDIHVENQVYTFTGQDMNVDYAFEEHLDDAIMVGRIGDVFARKAELKKAREEGREFISEYSYSQEALTAFAENVCQKSDAEPKDASMELDLTKEKYADSFVFTDEQPGLMIKKDGLLALCRQAVESQLPATINAPFDKPAPKIKVADLQANMQKISAFSTDYSSSADGRAKNVEKAVDKINGTLLLPGDTFSANETWGQRTEGNGWHLAPEIVNGDLQQGYGGGICQVSGTLFNAVTMADLEIVERRNHSFPSTYVKIGFDATVDWNGPDFKFKNNTEYPIVIFGKTAGKELFFEVWGRPLSFNAPGMQVTRESTVTKVLRSPSVQIIEDSSLPDTYSQVKVTPRQGRIVKSIVQFIVDGRVVKEITWTSEYRTINGVTVRGTKKTATPEPENPSATKPPKPTPEPDNTDNG